MAFLGIRYPFTKAEKEKYFLDLNNTDTSEIKTLILHIMLTPKKQRYRMPNFGSDLLKFIFEPDDNMTMQEIKESLGITLSTYIPGLSLNNITVQKSTTSPYAVYIRVDYTITQGVFSANDFVEIYL